MQRITEINKQKITPGYIVTPEESKDKRKINPEKKQMKESLTNRGAKIRITFGFSSETMQERNEIL